MANVLTEYKNLRVLRFGQFELALPSGELRKQGLRIKLQDQPLAVLCLLLEHPGEVVPRDVIRGRIWPADTFVDFDVGVNNAVKKIRQALGDQAETPRFVETIPRHGYRFIAPVEVIAAAAARTTSSAAPVGLAPLAAPPTVAHASARRTYGLVRLGLATAAAVMVAAGVYELAATRAVKVATPLAPSSIAVLPFENLSEPGSGDYFAEGMTDALITGLAQFSGLRVISRTSVLQYRRASKRTSQIAAELRVGAILEGSVVRAGSRVRIDVKLIDPSEDRHIWAHSYERDVRDILGVQQEVASAVAAQIAGQLRPASAAARVARAVNPDAYEAYLRGRYYLSGGPGLRQTAETLRTAATYFQQASRIDPGYAPGYAGLADVYYQFGFAYFVHTLSPAESIRQSEAAAQKAVAIDDSLPDGHVALARVRLAQWRWSEGESEARRAMELGPADSSAYAVYAQYLVSAGRAAEGATVVRQALDRDPFSPDLNGDLSWWLFEARDYERSLRQCRVEVGLNPANPRYRCFALIDEQQGRYAEAIERYRRLADLFADPNASANARAELARAYARSGNRREAQRLLNEVEALKRPDTAFPLAMAYAALGDRDTAFRFLDKAFAERSLWLSLAKVEPTLDPLRDDPRFKDLVHRMGLDAVH